MLRLEKLALLGVVGLVFAAAPARATILTFDIVNQANYGPITTYGTRVNGPNDADGSYLMGNGWTPNVVASYRTVDPNNQSTLTNHVDSWDTGYGDLVNVAFASSSGYLAEVTLTPDAGYGITLNSFDLAGWPFQDYLNQPLTIYDENYKVLLDYTPIAAPGSGHAHVEPALSHNGTIHIQFSNNWNVGIDNINFDQYRTSAVPEPATLVSAAFAAVAGLAVRSRRRRAG